MKLRGSFELASGLLLVSLDFLAVYLSYILSYFIYETWFGNSPQDLNEVLALAIIPAGLCVSTFTLSAVYRCQPGPVGLDQLRRLLSAYFWGGLVTLSLSFFTKSQGFSRLMVAFGFSIGFVFVLIGRALFVRLANSIRSNYKLDRRVLILGAGQVGRALARNLVGLAQGVKVIGLLDDQYPTISEIKVKVGEKEFLIPILGTLSDIETVSRQHRINEVIVAMTRATQALHQDLFDRVKDLKISFSIVPSALDLMLAGAESYSIGRIPLFRIGIKPTFILSPALKRAFDIVGGLVIGFLSAPLWIFASLAIRWTSKGPILFVHQRVGKDGQLFNLYKFRSMYIDSDPYSVTPQNQTDPRITPIGRWIRRTSIDELPQILNILRGEMSLVGPRPEMPFIVSTYDELQKMRLMVKPGLTGVWQISADRANAIHENIDYDLYYLENQSFWLDLAVLIKTFTSVVKGVGAY